MKALWQGIKDVLFMFSQMDVYLMCWLDARHGIPLPEIYTLLIWAYFLWHCFQWYVLLPRGKAII